MRKSTLAGLAVVVAATATARAQQPRPPEPVPIFLAPPPPAAAPGTRPERTPIVYVYDQKPLPQAPMLVSPEQAQAVIERFRTNFARLESPRVLININRGPFEPPSGHAIAQHSETIETTSVDPASGGPSGGVNTRTVVRNTLPGPEPLVPALADRQTTRDVERLFGRPLRLGGAVLVEQPAGAGLTGNRPVKELAAAEGQPAAKDHQALSQSVDVVIEVLVTWCNVVVPEVSGDRFYTVPEIQATAIRLRDARVIGQATAAEVMGRGQSVGYSARNFSVPDITEATALALMEDISQGVQARN